MEHDEIGAALACAARSVLLAGGTLPLGDQAPAPLPDGATKHKSSLEMYHAELCARNRTEFAYARVPARTVLRVRLNAPGVTRVTVSVADADASAAADGAITTVLVPGDATAAPAALA